MNWRHTLLVAVLLMSAGWARAELEVPEVSHETGQGNQTHSVQVPGVERWLMGEYEVFALSDRRFEIDAKQLAKLPQAHWSAALRKTFARDPAFKGVNAYALRKGKSVVLINAGRGTQQGDGLGWVVENLMSVGISPDEVTAVFLTSMHADHVTGLVDQADQRMFKNAYLFAASEAMAYWLADASYVGASDQHKLNFAATITSVMPYVKAGKLKPLDEGLAQWPAIKVIPLAGAKPGSVAYLIESGSDSLMVMGDAAATAAERRKARHMATQQKWRVADSMAPFPGAVRVQAARAQIPSYR